MSALPPEIDTYLLALQRQRTSPAYLMVSRDGRLAEAGGALDAYGLADLTPGIDVTEAFEPVVGLLPLEEPHVELPWVELGEDRHVEMHLFRGESADWVLLLDVTEGWRTQQLLQQHRNELTLALEVLEKRSRELEQTRRALIEKRRPAAD